MQEENRKNKNEKNIQEENYKELEKCIKGKKGEIRIIK